MTTTRLLSLFLLPLFLVSLLSGCFTFRAQIPGAVRADLVAADLEDVVVVDEVFTHYYFLHGAFGAPDDDIFEKRLLDLARLHGAHGLRDVEIEATFSCSGILLSILTLSLVHPRQYRIRGTLVKIDDAALPGQPLLP